MRRTSHKLQELDSLKGYPSQIAPTLTCLISVQDKSRDERWPDLVDCLLRELPGLTKTGKAKIENLISAQVLPTLRKLGLVEGHHVDTRLTYKGRYLGRNTDDLIRFKIGLAAIFLEIDAGRWNLVKAARHVRRYPGEAIPVYELALSLAEEGIDPCQSFRGIPESVQLSFRRLGVDHNGSRSRLSDMLRFYDFVDVLRRSDGFVTLLDSTLQRAANAASKMVRPGVKLEEFFSALLEEYSDLSKRLDSPYVPIIPALREPICDRLAIDDRMFADSLLKIVPSFGQYRILLSPPSGGRPQWQTITSGGSRYYYLSIYREEKPGAESL